MNSKITRTLTVSLAIAAALALPTAVKAQADDVAENDPVATATAEELSTESNVCFYIPGYGWVCF